MVAILTELNYANNTSCKLRYSSLIDTLRKKRIPYCEVFDTIPCDIDGIFVISADIDWTIHTIKQLNLNGYTPILISDLTGGLPGCIYNSVCSDVNASMKNLLEFLKFQQKQHLALYGFNPNSISDNSKFTFLKNWNDNHFKSFDLFENNGSLHECYKNFAENCTKYDSVVCANDFAAISLVKLLETQAPEQLTKLTIISCTSSSLSECYKDKILTLNINHEQYGRAAVYIYEALQKHEYASSLSIRIVWDFEATTVSKATPKSLTLNFIHSADTFYNDESIRDLLIANNYLNSADSTDRIIIKMLIENKSLDDIAEKCFLSINAIKYRIKRLVSNSGATDKNHLIELIEKYVNNG